MLIAKGEHAPSMDLNKQDKFRVQFVRMGPGGCVLSLSHLYSSAPAVQTPCDFYRGSSRATEGRNARRNPANRWAEIAALPDAKGYMKDQVEGGALRASWLGTHILESRSTVRHRG